MANDERIERFLYRLRELGPFGGRVDMSIQDAQALQEVIRERRPYGFMQNIRVSMNSDFSNHVDCLNFVTAAPDQSGVWCVNPTTNELSYWPCHKEIPRRQAVQLFTSTIEIAKECAASSAPCPGTLYTKVDSGLLVQLIKIAKDVSEAAE